MEEFILYLIPVFIAFMMGESVWSAWQNRHLYETKDTWINIGMGIAGLFCDLLVKGLALSLLTIVHRHALFQLPSHWAVWVGAFLLQDFFDYLMHLMEHKTRVLWAVHVNHHSSKKYNFSTAVRSSVLQPLYHYLFFLPISWLGFDPLIILFSYSIGQVYSFFLHTETIGKLGPLEWFMNTPSHHRVHHGMNEKYLDKNMAQIFIIWDRIFGTFQEEDEPVKYGLTKEFNSTNFITVVFHELNALWSDLKKPVPIRTKLQFLFNSPGKQPADKLIKNTTPAHTAPTPDKSLPSTTSVTAILLLLCSIQFVVAQPYLDVFNLKYQSFPATAYQENTGATLAIRQLAGNVMLPLVLKNKDVVLTGAAAESLLFHARDAKKETYALHAVVVQLGYIRQWRNSHWKTMAMLLPKISSDFRQVSGNDLQLGGIVLNTYQKTGKLAYKIGLYYNREFFGNFIMPLLGIDWQATNHVRVFGVLPGSMNMEYQLNKKWYAGISYQSITGSYRLTGISADSYVRNGGKSSGHNQLRVFVYRYVAKNIAWYAEAGHTLWRKFEAYDADHVKISDAPVFQAARDHWLFNTGIACRIRTNNP